jgi:predicted transcriptional regulator
MIETIDTGLSELDTLSRFLGTPSAQKVFQLMVCWKSLSKKDLIDKTSFSESQIYLTLNNLEKIGLIEKKSRGVYGLTDAKFTNLLKNAYLSKLEQIIGKELYFIGKNLDSLPSNNLIKLWSQLIDQWEPILNEKFPEKVSSLAGHILEIESINN